VDELREAIIEEINELTERCRDASEEEIVELRNAILALKEELCGLESK